MAKISPEFNARLSGLDPDDRIQAILLLDTSPIGRDRAPRRSHGRRESMIVVLREATAPAVQEVDRILQRFGGHLLAPEVNALGAIPVETTVAGTREQVTLPQVKAILEDQPVVALP
jgi:hypothetical protein